MKFERLTPQRIDFPKIGDVTLGYISVSETQKSVPFDIKRVYWTYFTPDSITRGGHAHRELEQVVIAVAGTIVFDVEDCFGNKQVFELSQPHTGVYLPPFSWRDIRFSHNAVLLCLASEHYNEHDYLRDYDVYKSSALQLLTTLNNSVQEDL